MSDLLERLKAALADRYAIESEIGRGGMAIVFLAEDLRHRRQVAIKVLQPELAATVGTTRFLREIETVAAFDHPQLLPLYDSGEADGLLYFVMPYVEGESLRERLEREGPLPVDQALGIAVEVADGLAYAHRHGVVHRDIKPGNILLSAGHARISDFGVARAIGVASGGDATATGLAVGTAKYMSPEQAAGSAEIDGRSDIYALGCVLWEMLAGEPPWDAPTPHGVLARKAVEEPPEVRVARKTVPRSLGNVLARAMATSPADRFQTAGELAKALREPETLGRVRRRGRRSWGTAAAVAAIMAVGAGLWSLGSRGFFGSTSEVPAFMPLDSTRIAVLPFQVVGADSTSPVHTFALSPGTLFEAKVGGASEPRFAHPGSVVQVWRRAGGSFEGELPEAAQRELGRAMGAGKLVRGTIVIAGDEVTLAASMVDVATGEIRVPTVRVAGSVDALMNLADQLIVLVLSGDRSVTAETTQHLRRYKPDATQALLSGDYAAALAADSTLIDAAVYLYANGERDTAALRYALNHQDQLSRKARTYLQALIHRRRGEGVEAIAAFEALVRLYPTWVLARRELSQNLARHGAQASVPDWRQRARDEFESIETPEAFDWLYLSELAFIDRDSARIRVAVDSLLALTAGDTYGPLARKAPAYAWRRAVVEGDTVAQALALAETRDSSWVPAFAFADGRGIADGDRVVASGAADAGWYPDNWHWARGRDTEWREARYRPYRRPENRPIVPVMRALLLGPSEDSVATESVSTLKRIAAAGDEASVSPESRVRAGCWLSLWRLEHGDTTGVRAVLRRIDAFNGPRSFDGWKGLLEMLLTRLEGGDIRVQLWQADSLVRALGPTGYEAEIQNLMLARLLRQIGEYDRALAASRRRRYGWFAMDYSVGALPEYLREEATLAVAVGDTNGAVEAYRHYFALRDSRPDHPTWAAQWDSMRVEFGDLTGVESP